MATEARLRLPFEDEKKWRAIEGVLRGPLARPGTAADVDRLIEALSGSKCTWFERTARQFSAPDAFDWPGFVAAVPLLAALALELPVLFAPLPAGLPRLLRFSYATAAAAGTPDQAVTLSRKQVACLLVHSFFGTLTGEDRPEERGFNSFSVRRLFHPDNLAAPGLCVANYLRRIATTDAPTLGSTEITVRRHFVPESRDWTASTAALCNVQLIESGSITDSAAEYHADFANEYIGGGALDGGCAQEEILFAVKPELIVSMALCDRMDVREVIVITGARRYSLTTGYGFNYQWDRDAPPEEHTPAVVAFDASVASRVNQFMPAVVSRDLHKAYAAFEAAGKGATFATGNWGTGAFGGDEHLKFLQQWLAASEAGISKLDYYAFENPQMAPVAGLIEQLRKYSPTVGSLSSVLFGILPTLKKGEVIDQVLARAKASPKP
jgi:poly(ADP-ribose) glycohydrolase